MVPRGPPAHKVLLDVTSAGIRSGHRGQLVVQGNVAEPGDEKRAHDVEERPSQEEGRGRTTPACQGEPARAWPHFPGGE